MVDNQITRVHTVIQQNKVCWFIGGLKSARAAHGIMKIIIVTLHVGFSDTSEVT